MGHSSFELWVICVEFVDALFSAPDARHYFLLSCQKKVSKEKSRPQRRPATPGALRCSAATGGCGTRTFGPQTVLAPLSVASCAARRRKGQDENQPDINRQPLRFRSVCFSSPSWSAEQRSAAGSSRRGLSEGEARVPQPPGRTSSAGQPAKPAAQRGGRLFFGFFLLATQKKECPRVRRGKQSVPPPSHLSKPIPKSCPVQSATSRLPPGLP